MMNAKWTVAGVALTVLIGTSGTVAASGQFQLRIDKDGVQFGASLDPRQHGYEHAYRDGADRGRFDREHGVRYNLNARFYSDSSRGYKTYMGNKGQYQQGYREGYKAGYDSAYRGTADRYGQIYGRTEENRNQWQHTLDPYASRKWGAMDLAFDTGYRDGVTAGQYRSWQERTVRLRGHGRLPECQSWVRQKLRRKRGVPGSVPHRVSARLSGWLRPFALASNGRRVSIRRPRFLRAHGQVMH